MKGTIHWVSAEQNIPFEGRLYDVLMRDDDEQAETAPEEKPTRRPLRLRRTLSPA
ncbi:MAG: hypothetical protein ACLR4A_14570 [Christensenellales bacterium]